MNAVACTIYDLPGEIIEYILNFIQDPFHRARVAFPFLNFKNWEERTNLLQSIVTQCKTQILNMTCETGIFPVSSEKRTEKYRVNYVRKRWFDIHYCQECGNRSSDTRWKLKFDSQITNLRTCYLCLVEWVQKQTCDCGSPMICYERFNTSTMYFPHWDVSEPEYFPEKFSKEKIRVMSGSSPSGIVAGCPNVPALKNILQCDSITDHLSVKEGKSVPDGYAWCNKRIVVARRNYNTHVRQRRDFLKENKAARRNPADENVSLLVNDSTESGISKEDLNWYPCYNCYTTDVWGDKHYDRFLTIKAAALDSNYDDDKGWGCEKCAERVLNYFHSFDLAKRKSSGIWLSRAYYNGKNTTAHWKLIDYRGKNEESILKAKRTPTFSDIDHVLSYEQLMPKKKRARKKRKSSSSSSTVK